VLGADIIHQKARLHIVGAVDDQIRMSEDVFCIVEVEILNDVVDDNV